MAHQAQVLHEIPSSANHEASASPRSDNNHRPEPLDRRHEALVMIMNGRQSFNKARSSEDVGRGLVISGFNQSAKLQEARNILVASMQKETRILNVGKGRGIVSNCTDDNENDEETTPDATNGRK